MVKKKFKGNADKCDGGQFIKLPMVVIESPGFRRAGYAARALLLDVAMQYVGNNNGRLTAGTKYMRSKGWSSNETIFKARRELIECGLLIETRKGGFPNKGAWYALSWLDLDQWQGLDIDPNAYNRVHRRSYMQPAKVARTKRTSLVPNDGAAEEEVTPISGARPEVPAPVFGAVLAANEVRPAPVGGTYLEIPSAKDIAAVLALPKPTLPAIDGHIDRGKPSCVVGRRSHDRTLATGGARG